VKVIHIFNELKYSGAEIMYSDAASLFQKLGFELTALSTAKNVGEFATVLEKQGYEILHKPYPKLKNFLSRIKYYYCFIQFLKKEDFDVVHIHRNNAMWGMSLCSWIANRRAIYTFHNVFSCSKSTYLYHSLLRWSAKHVFKCNFQTISDSVYENELNYFHNKTKKIYNWYGSDRFYPGVLNEKEAIRKELNIQPETLVLISIGGCSDIKRHSDIIKAMKVVIETQPDCIYLHLGEGASEIKEIKLTGELGLINHIRFAKNQRDVRKYLVASDLYLMTSKFEGISLTTIEAMASRIPCILYDVAGLRDFNKTGENSLLIPEDYEILAQKILYLNSKSNKRIELANNAKKFVDYNFNMEENVRKIALLYKNVKQS